MTRSGSCKSATLVLVLVLVLLAKEAAAEQQHLYFAFFPETAEAEQEMKDVARSSLRQLLSSTNVRAAYANFTNNSADSSVEQLVEFAFTNPTKRLHVTTKFCNYSCSEYWQQAAVQESLNGEFTVNASHLVLTPRTFGFRAQLTPRQLRVWAQPGEQVRGERAHFTVSTAPGVPAVQTGLDLLAILRRQGRPLAVSVDGVAEVLDYGEAQFAMRFTDTRRVATRFRGSDTNSAPSAASALWHLVIGCVCSLLLIGC